MRHHEKITSIFRGIMTMLCIAAASTVWALPADSVKVTQTKEGNLSEGVKLGDVEVYGSSNNFGVRSSQMSALTLDHKQILSVPVFLGEPDVLKSIQKLPGVQAGSEGSAGIFVRGGDYDQNYITLDGTAIYNSEHLKGYVSAINPDMVKSINFYRGAFPARYGSRLSSVVDIGIKEGDFNRFHGLLSLGMLSSRAQVEGPIWKGHTSFNIGARVSYLNFIALPLLKHYYDQKTSVQPYVNMNYYDITAKIVHKFNNRNRLSAVFYFGNDSNNENPTESNITRHRVEDLPPWILNEQFPEGWEQHIPLEEKYNYGSRRSSSNKHTWNNILSSLYFTSFVNNDHRLNVNLSYSQYIYKNESQNYSQERIRDVIRMYYQRYETNRTTFHSGVQDLALTFDAVWKINDKHKLRYGLKGSGQRLNPHYSVYRDFYASRFKKGINWKGDIDTIPGSPYSVTAERVDYTNNENLDMYNLSLYAEDDFSLYDNLKFNYGLRFSSYFVKGKTYLALEPRLSVRYLIDDNLAIKASYARMTQGIHRLVSNNLVMPSDIWVPITEKIPLMTSNQYGLGINFEWKGFHLSGEAYYKSLDNVVEYKNGATYFVQNTDWRDMVATGRGKSYGFEFMLERKTGKTTGWISYTWSKALRKFDRAGNIINAGKEFYSTSDRRHNISFNITQHIPMTKKINMDISASWVYQSGRRGTVPYHITYGQSIREYNLKAPYYIYGEHLFDFLSYISNELYNTEFNSTTVTFGPYPVYKNVNDFKLPDTHHLDINMNLSIKYSWGESIIGLGVYNLYNHFNVSSVYIGYDKGKSVLKGICPFPVMPSISYTQKF